MDVYEECKLAFDSFVYRLFYAVYIDMGLSSNSPVVLTVVTSGQSFARSFSVKVGISVNICIYICFLYLYLDLQCQSRSR